jgi:hypothetical protein
MVTIEEYIIDIVKDYNWWLDDLDDDDEVLYKNRDDALEQVKDIVYEYGKPKGEDDINVDEDDDKLWGKHTFGVDMRPIKDDHLSEFIHRLTLSGAEYGACVINIIKNDSNIVFRCHRCWYDDETIYSEGGEIGRSEKDNLEKVFDDYIDEHVDYKADIIIKYWFKDNTIQRFEIGDVIGPKAI